MISLDTNQKSSSSSTSLPLTNEEKPTLSFSDLLKGVSTQTEGKSSQNGLLVLSLDETSVEEQEGLGTQSLSKTNTLLSLLKSTPTTVTALESKNVATTTTMIASIKEPLTINSEISSKLSQTDLKVLINEAKEYLKSKITESPSFDKTKTTEFPKTLKGLVDLAQSLKIDVSKISFEDIKSSVTIELGRETKEPKQLKTNNLQKAMQTTQPAQTTAKSQPTQTTATRQPAQTTATTQPIQTTATTQPVQTTATTASTSPTQKTETLLEKVPQELQMKEELQSEGKKTLQNTELKQTPLFKAQTKPELTTQEIVNTKVSTLQEQKSPTKKADETLKMLLQGKTVVKKESGFTADFSVATARVIAPDATQKPQRATDSLESLLKGNTQENNTPSKIDGLNVSKADSLEVKMNEAKQMTKYLSADVKTAIDDYKSPFTRVKVDLNPQRLGSVEVTIVQRGKNLHINLSSNNSAINALSMNVNDLKTQLTNNGINNATLNFNNNSQTAEQSFSGQQQQQQNSHQEREARREYGYLENEEQHEEQMSSLEIVVPNYA